MGCFSFECQECGRGVKSSSFSGEQVHLFLLKEGKVLQQMTGEYDSYGRVFIDNTQAKGVKHDLRKSQEWKDPTGDLVEDRTVWSKVCDLMHGDDITNGIAAIHVSCFKQIPTVRSMRDPNQGWGDEDDEENYFASTEGEGHEYPRPKPIPGYNVMTEHRKEAIRSKLWKLEHNSLDLDLLKQCIDSKFKDVALEERVNKNEKKRMEKIAALQAELIELEKK